MRKVAFITNLCPHYRVKTFETLARYHDVDFYFFSAGKEWYWEQRHGLRTGRFRYQYLSGFEILGTRITPSLISKLLRGRYDVIVKCINGRFALPATYLLARLKSRPIILWTGVWGDIQTPFHRLFFPVARYLYRHMDAIVVYGSHVKRYLVSHGVSAEKIFIANHAVDNPHYGAPVPVLEIQELRRRLDIGERPVVLFLGRLEDGKGLDYLLKAFVSITRDAVLVLAGDGSLNSVLREQIEQLGLTARVRFTGYITPEKTRACYALAEVFVLPSVTTAVFKEPWGLVVNEALNQGIPVVATDAVGAAAGGLVQDGVNGFIVPERDPAALAACIQTLLNDPALRHRMSTAARSIIATWDNERMVEGFRTAIEFVCRR